MRPHTRVLRCGAHATTPSIGVHFVSHTGHAAEAQKEALRHVIRTHEVAVQRNAFQKKTDNSTYDDLSCLFFPAYNLCSLPPTSGRHRENVRKELVSSGALTSVATSLLNGWQSASNRCAVVFGAKSTPYLARQLEADDAHSLLVVDHSLKNLANCAARLVPQFQSRVSFLRAEPMFTCLEVLPPTSTDVVITAMPTPFWSESGSHRRLVTRDFLWAVHRITRTRDSPEDPRGFVCFTDSEPYADFIMEQLEEAKLLVPWTRKNPHQTYERWLPLTPSSTSDAPREFPQQRFPEVIAISGSKSGETSPQALEHMASFDYKRRYYRSLNGGEADGGADVFTD